MGEGLKLLIKIETLPNAPEIKWGEIAVEKYEGEIEESDIEKVKNQILRNFREYSEADKNYKIQIDDKVIVSYEGKIDGQAFEGNKEKSVEMVIGSGNFSKEFEEQLVGLKEDESKEVNMIFPEDYANKELSLKHAVFNVRVHKISQLEKIKEVTAKMLESVGIKNEEELRDGIIKNIKNNNEMLSRKIMQSDIMRELNKIRFTRNSGVVLSVQGVRM